MMAFAISDLRWLSLAAGTMLGMDTHISTWNLDGSAARSALGSRSAYVWKPVRLSVTAHGLFGRGCKVRPDQPVVIWPKIGARHSATSGALNGEAMLHRNFPACLPHRGRALCNANRFSQCAKTPKGFGCSFKWGHGACIALSRS